MTYRQLTFEEISNLERLGCTADNWKLVTVKEEFVPTRIRNVHFSGHVQLGVFGGDLKPEGIINSTIENCNIEDHVLVNQVGRLSNYIVRSHAVIDNCATITSKENAVFGNGTSAAVINEAGGREVLLFDGLTAQLAWLMAFMQHRPLFIQKLRDLITDKTKHVLPEKGIIGHHATVKNCNTIADVLIGDYATIEGVTRLINGTISSNEHSPAYVGHGVLASNFFTSTGSTVDSSSIIKNSFIGEGCIIDRQFSADNSLCFANSQLFHGEACSAFCAPYTVSHHKSTLLIAGYFSFINVGSGSNQSNHMYKLGPVHQGVLERGCKLSSDSYLMWPAKIAPYTFVMGRHYSNPDISNFPFSYLLDEDGTSMLVPGANLRSIGTIRDSDKWPSRDIRKGIKSDLINFELFNPFIVEKALKGKEQLENILQTQKADSGHYNIGDVNIKKPALRRGIDIYTELSLLYAGDMLFKRFCKSTEPINEILEVLHNHKSIKTEGWCDMAGLFAPISRVEQLVEIVETSQSMTLSKVIKHLEEINTNSDNDEWNWLLSNWKELTQTDLSSIDAETLNGVIIKWTDASSQFTNMLIKDAQKEFNERSKIGYGYNDDTTTRQLEFANIRGTCETNSFVKQLKENNDLKIKWAQRL